MDAATVQETYRRMIAEVGEWVAIRRYTGQGINRSRFDVEVRARVTGYAPDELIGAIQQGDRRVIVLVQDLIDEQLALPIRASDKVIVRGNELAIMAPDDSTRRMGGLLIAYELNARG